MYFSCFIKGLQPQCEDEVGRNLFPGFVLGEVLPGEGEGLHQRRWGGGFHEIKELQFQRFLGGAFFLGGEQ